MRLGVVLILSFAALSSAQVQVRLPFINPAGVTFTGVGYGNVYHTNQQQQGQLAQVRSENKEEQVEPAPQQEQPQQQEQQQEVAQEVQPAPQEQEQNQPQEQQQQVQQQQVVQQQQPQQIQQQFYNYPQQFAYARPAPLQYHRAIQYAPAVQQKVAYAAAPVVHQKVAYAAAPVVQHQKFAYAAPAVAVHQKIGYASTPVHTQVAGVADVPVTKLAYSQGYTQQEVDVHTPAVTTRKVKVRRPAVRKEFYDIEHRVIVRPAGSATLELSQPISKEQQGPAVLTATKYAHVAPVVRYGASRRIVDGDASASGAFSYLRSSPSAAPRAAVSPAPSQAPEAAPSARQAVDADTEVVEAARDDSNSAPSQEQPQEAPAQEPEQPQGEQQQQPEQPQQEVSSTAAPESTPAPTNNNNGGENEGRGISITPDMPLALQKRLLELLTAKGGTVTEILNQDGTPADSASVLQVADALGDPSLQGGERITTRRIVISRPIETIQEIEVQEPATKIHRKILQQPTLFKHAVPAVARVPVSIPAVKHVATPVVKTTYAAAGPAAYSFNYHGPNAQYAYHH